MAAKARNFDVTYPVASGMWRVIAWSGEDTVAVARASYEAGGNVRHRVHAVAFLSFDARYSAEAREFAVELLEDRSPRVARLASDALAWGGDVTLLSRMRKIAAERTDGAKRDIEDAIAQVEFGNQHLFPHRTRGPNVMFGDHDWRQMRGGLIRVAQPRHVPLLLDSAPEGASSRVPLVGCDPPLNEQDIRALVEARSCWMVGAPVTGTLVAQLSGRDWLIKSIAVAEQEQDSGLAWELVEFAEQQGRRRGLERIVLNARARAWPDLEAFGRHGYREADRSCDEDGLEAVLYEKAL
jgi:ribosomal protein S18 acetylase RimI-like enzyme